MTMTVRAKFKCVSKSPEGDLRLEAVTSGSQENETWANYTPSGTLLMRVDNPAATEQFEAGKPYYLDFTPAE